MNNQLDIRDLNIDDIIMYNSQLYKVMNFKRSTPLCAPYEVGLRLHSDDSTSVIPVSYVEVHKMHLVYKAG